MKWFLRCLQFGDFVMFGSNEHTVVITVNSLQQLGNTVKLAKQM